MTAAEISHALASLLDHLGTAFAPTGWYLSDRCPANAVLPDPDQWSCMFSHFQSVMEGRSVAFRRRQTGCAGAACYLGFRRPSAGAGRFLSEQEGFKKTPDLGQAFYREIAVSTPKSRFVVWGPLADTAASNAIEVINLWIDSDGLSPLVTLANYDRPDNDNVMIPFASGCQSIWTLPFAEAASVRAKCVIGCMDPAMRKHLPPGVLAFSAPASRLLEMAGHVAGSFLKRKRSSEPTPRGSEGISR